MVETGRGQAGLDGILHVGTEVRLRQLRGEGGEAGVGLQGELVAGQVLGLQCQGGVQIRQGLLQALAGQAIHQVQVEAFEMPGGQGGGAEGLVPVVDAAQGLEVSRVEALDAEGHPVDAGGAKARELFRLHRAGVGLQGDFRPRLQWHPGSHRHQQPVDSFGGEQAGGAAAEEKTQHRPAPDQRQGALQVRHQGIQVGRFRNLTPGLVGIEVAIGALLHAPGQVDIEGKRRGEREFKPRPRPLAGREDGNDAGHGIRTGKGGGRHGVYSDSRTGESSSPAWTRCSTQRIRPMRPLPSLNGWMLSNW